MAALAVATACAGSTDPWADPGGVQLALPGDWICSDPVFGEVAGQCCAVHDAAYWAGGTESDRQTADHEFGACMALWGVPPDVVDLRVWAVRRFGASSFHYTTHRTRGPP